MSFETDKDTFGPPSCAGGGAEEIAKSDLVPAPVEPVRLTKEGKPFREQRRGKIDDLPDEVRGELDHKLGTDSFRSYRVVSEWLEEEHAARISPSALHYHKKHLDLALLPVKFATKEAQQIVEASGGDNEEINRALTMLIQTKMYEMLVQMNTVIEAFDQVEKANEQSGKVMDARAQKSAQDNPDGADADPETSDTAARATKTPNKAALAALSVLVKNTKEIGEHVTDSQRWDLERDSKLARQIEAASQKVSKVASEGGLSPEAEATIRAALMEIKL